MSYARDGDTIIQKFYEFIDWLAEYKNLEESYEFPVITDLYWILEIVLVEDEDVNNIIEIVEQTHNGNMNYLKRFSEVKNYMKFIYRSLIDKHNNRRDWRYKCPELHPDVYEIEENLIWVLKDLFVFLKRPLSGIFHIITTNEKIGLSGLCSQYKLPTDIEYYICDYIGMWQINT
jgi:hypothetical protein